MSARVGTKVTWMGHAGHFICGRDCGFRLACHVNGFIISTVGELKYGSDSDDAPMRTLGASPDSFYETMVFKAVKSNHVCCPFQMESGSEIDGKLYENAEDATRGHMAFLKKWAAK